MVPPRPRPAAHAATSRTRTGPRRRPCACPRWASRYGSPSYMGCLPGRSSCGARPQRGENATLLPHFASMATSWRETSSQVKNLASHHRVWSVRSFVRHPLGLAVERMQASRGGRPFRLLKDRLAGDFHPEDVRIIEAGDLRRSPPLSKRPQACGPPPAQPAQKFDGDAMAHVLSMKFTAPRTCQPRLAERVRIPREIGRQPGPKRSTPRTRTGRPCMSNGPSHCARSR